MGIGGKKCSQSFGMRCEVTQEKEKSGEVGTYERADVNNSVVDWVGTVNDELGGASSLDGLKHSVSNWIRY